MLLSLRKNGLDSLFKEVRVFKECKHNTLKTRTSLNKESRAFFLGDNSIWSFPSFLPLAITAFGVHEGYFSLALIAFGAFQFVVPKS